MNLTICLLGTTFIPFRPRHVHIFRPQRYSCLLLVLTSGSHLPTPRWQNIDNGSTGEVPLRPRFMMLLGVFLLIAKPDGIAYGAAETQHKSETEGLSWRIVGGFFVWLGLNEFGRRGGSLLALYERVFPVTVQQQVGRVSTVVVFSLNSVCLGLLFTVLSLAMAVFEKVFPHCGAQAWLRARVFLMFQGNARVVVKENVREFYGRWEAGGAHPAVQLCLIGCQAMQRRLWHGPCHDFYRGDGDHVQRRQHDEDPHSSPAGEEQMNVVREAVRAPEKDQAGGEQFSPQAVVRANRRDESDCITGVVRDSCDSLSCAELRLALVYPLYVVFMGVLFAVVPTLIWLFVVLHEHLVDVAYGLVLEVWVWLGLLGGAGRGFCTKWCISSVLEDSR